MKIAIIQFPGSNCERETMLAVKRAGMIPVEFLWNAPRHLLEEMDGYIIVGGFSYEDRARAGIIAALDPVMLELKKQSEKGKPILGICNGAQILVETGLVPGLENNKLAMALTENKRIVNDKILGTGYYNAWVNMRVSDSYQRNAFTRSLSTKHLLSIPIAHGEGRFIMPDALWHEVEQQGLHVFQYCDEKGALINSFPTNPNGSMHNIAAISNKAGNVLAMMPHPERTINGDVIFKSMRDYIKEGALEKNSAEHVTPLYYYPRRTKLGSYQKNKSSKECIVELMISDLQALTVQNTLHQLGIDVSVKRFAHWEIDSKDIDEHFNQIKKSGVLFNERKEKVVSFIKNQTLKQGLMFLVRAKEDLLGQQKLQILKDHFSIQDMTSIQYSVLWHFSSETANITDLTHNILQTNIIYNPYAHDCYQYDPFIA